MKIMNFCRKFGIVLFGAFAAFAVFAHQIPAQVLDFLTQNPDASEEQVRSFLDQNGFEEFGVFWGDPSGTPSTESSVNPLAEKTPNFMQNLKNFIFLGVEHILLGIDHILFVLVLLLGLKTFSEVLKIITIFTVAHSITLIFSVFGGINLSPEIVEPMIAFSIIFMGILNGFFPKKFSNKKSKWVNMLVVFGFGLFHGLGFAGSLSSTKIPTEFFWSSLLGFNIGVEIGQLMVIAVTLPLIGWIINKYGKGKMILAGIFSVIGAYWFFERVFA